MKPIHFRPNPDTSARDEAAQRAYEASQGPGVAAVVRSATSTKQPAVIHRQRRVQVDDYVAKIRQTAQDTCPTEPRESHQTARPEVIFKTRIQDDSEVSNRNPRSCLANGINFCLSASRTLTNALPCLGI